MYPFDRAPSETGAENPHPAIDGSRSGEATSLAVLPCRKGDSQASATATTDTEVSAIMAGRMPSIVPSTPPTRAPPVQPIWSATRAGLSLGLVHHSGWSSTRAGPSLGLSARLMHLDRLAVWVGDRQQRAEVLAVQLRRESRFLQSCRKLH